MSLFHKIALGGALLFTASAVMAQTPAPAAPATPPPQAIPNPTYTTLVLEIDVNKPAAEVWAKVGKYCDIKDWLGVTCEITSGVAGELGSVRTLNGVTIEPLVGKTDLSYVYAQPVRVGVPYNLYHGGLEAKPVTATTTKLIYTFFYDNSMLANDAARAAERTNRTNRFMPAMQKMKAIAEAG
jgi:hypothetical protein